MSTQSSGQHPLTAQANHKKTDTTLELVISFEMRTSAAAKEIPTAVHLQGIPDLEQITEVSPLSQLPSSLRHNTRQNDKMMHECG